MGTVKIVSWFYLCADFMTPQRAVSTNQPHLIPGCGVFCVRGPLSHGFAAGAGNTGGRRGGSRGKGPVGAVPGGHRVICCDAREKVE